MRGVKLIMEEVNENIPNSENASATTTSKYCFYYLLKHVIEFVATFRVFVLDWACAKFATGLRLNTPAPDVK